MSNCWYDVKFHIRDLSTEPMLKPENINRVAETVVKVWTAQSSNNHFRKPRY